jgi:phosphomethylpyrimidine synthase
MKTLIEKIRNKQTPEIVKRIAKLESLDVKDLCSHIKNGLAVICSNPRHNPSKPCAVGKDLKTKVNVNLGTSPDFTCLKSELRKLQISLEYGADAVMDLSTGGNLRQIRRKIISKCPVSIGTVPIYETAVINTKKKKKIKDMSIEDIFNTIKRQAEDGVDFMTLHCGLTLETLNRLKAEGRLLNIVSRGGAFLANWMMHNNRENPLYEHYGELLDILHDYDVTISLGDGLRPGCIDDATDRAQIQELIFLGELAQKANKKGVQAIIEGPGHVPLNEIETNMQLEKKLCNGTPFYVLGPLVTDAAVGYDHIAASIGAAIAATYGADFICYLTPAEHLGLPSDEDVKEGLIATRIAAHAADVAKGNKEALLRDKKLSIARQQRNFPKQFELALEPRKAQNKYKELKSRKKDVCSMCSEFCAIKTIEEVLEK